MQRKVRRQLLFEAVAALALAYTMLLGTVSAADKPWKFGVMADTQWKANLDGQNPGTVAVGIINQLNEQFKQHDVKFVIQVGDLVDSESDSNGRTMPVRANAAQALYDAGIGFYPLRGNHEGSKDAALEFQALYPQAQGIGPNVVGAKNFSSPTFLGDPAPDKLKGLSYSFDYMNARFVLLDQFTRTDGTNYLGSSNNNALDQLPWITNALEEKPKSNHAFIFSHKNLIGQNHADTLFGANPFSNILYQDWLFGALQNNGVHYQFGGHDHMHHRSYIMSSRGYSGIQEVICSSNSYKFYIPPDVSNDEKYNLPATTGLGFLREAAIAEELFTVGYYIVTVDGPRVTVDFYSSPNGCGGDCDLIATPSLTFTKRDTFGYSLNGQEFFIPQGGSFSVVEDGYQGTTAKILGGTNSSTDTVYDGRPLTKSVDTGWALDSKWDILTSNILSLWGMEKGLGSDETDVFVLSLSYDHEKYWPWHLGTGGFGIATKDAAGNWVNAVDQNFGGTKRFVVGPWNPGYELGTYGVDPYTHTAWAVINYNSEFAVAKNIKPPSRHGNK